MSAYQQLEQTFNRISNLNHLQAMTGWDEAVMMPLGGGPARASALATLQGMLHELLIDPKNADLIDQAKQEDLHDSWKHANLNWMEKKYRDATCLPTELVEALTESAMQSEQAWRTLRAENNWKDFAPLFEKTLNLVKESAQIRAEASKLSPYDVLIDEFSPGINQKMIDPIFEQLKKELPALADKVIEKQRHDTVLPAQGPFAIEKQREVGLDLMRAIGFNFDHGRLDVSHHPFCGGVPQDVRITTRYNEREFITAAMGICHETGHAKYEQQLPEQWLHQPVGVALGMTVHESQSLLVEMQACRSHEFMHFMSQLVIQQFGEDDAFSPGNLYKLYTRVNRGFIRVDADEITYPLHIIVRYELEKQLMQNTLQVKDLPDAWDGLMQHYLGLSTKDNFHDGLMQDVHWPSAAFGYFPAYTLGALTGAQLFAHAKTAHPEMMDEFKQGQFFTLMQWLKKNVHSKASSLSFKELIASATGEELNSKYFIEHLHTRYLTGSVYTQHG